MPSLRPVAPEEIASLPFQMVEAAHLSCSPAQLFASFQRDADWKAWFDLEVTPTTEGPYREGFTRTVKTGPMVLDEVFTVWAPNEAMAFYVERTNNPFLTAFAEHYSVEATADGCILTWRIGMEFNLVGRLLGPIFKCFLERGARKGFPKLERVASNG